MASTSSSDQSEPAPDSKDKFIGAKFIPKEFRQAAFKNRVRNLPATIQNRVIALKNDQLKCIHIESDYWKDIKKLEEKYQQKYQTLMDKRQKIVTGEIDPPKEEPKWLEQKEKKEKNLKDLEPFQPIIEKFKQLPTDFKGLPNFWPIVFRNCAVFSMTDYDVPALQKLLDVKVKYDADGSFTLEFLFDKNEYFTDTVLTKKYYVTLHVDEINLYNFEGPMIFKSEGCKINWKESKDLTVQTIKKTENTNECEQVPCASFFNFFKAPVAPQNVYTVDWANNPMLSTDFELGKTLRYTIIPKAVLFYSGDLVLDAEEEDSYDDEKWKFEDNYSEVDVSPNGAHKPKN